MRLALSKACAGCLVFLSVVALSACGGSTNSSNAGNAGALSPAGRVVDVYSSLPLRGPEAADAAQRVQSPLSTCRWTTR
jgi:hypothetical protein